MRFVVYDECFPWRQHRSEGEVNRTELLLKLHRRGKLYGRLNTELDDLLDRRDRNNPPPSPEDLGAAT